MYEFAELGRIAWPLSSLFLLCRETIFGYRPSTPLRYSSYTRCDLPFGRNASENKSVSRWKTWGEEERETRAFLDNDWQCQRSRSALVERTTITLYYESFSNIDGFERKDNWIFWNYRGRTRIVSARNVRSEWIFSTNFKKVTNLPGTNDKTRGKKWFNRSYRLIIRLNEKFELFGGSYYQKSTRLPISVLVDL